MTTWNRLAPWSSAVSRCSRRLIASDEPSMAAMRSIQTNPGSSAMALPPGSAAALADQSGFTYAVAPT